MQPPGESLKNKSIHQMKKAEEKISNIKYLKNL